MASFTMRITVMDAETGAFIWSHDMNDHGWPSETDARKAWKGRRLFETDEYLLDFNSVDTRACVLRMTEFIAA